MANFVDSINQAFLDIFTIFSLGIRKNSSRCLKFFFLAVNICLVLSILVTYIYKGKLIISADALSQITDVFELFAPILNHTFLLLNFLKNHKVFEGICEISDNLDEQFNAMNPSYFRKVKTTSTLYFCVKFFVVHGAGVGIDSFVIIT
jgi:hypothetical protein